MSNPFREEIDQFIGSKPVAIFMKGTLDFPMCGFSARAAQIFEALGVPRDKIADFNVLDNRPLFEELKQYKEWPTSPQVYLKGELLGGSDILMEMYESGELADLLKEV